MDEVQSELIDQYLDGTLAGEPLRAFRSALNRSEALRQAVEVQRLVRQGLQRMGDRELRATFRALHAEMVAEAAGTGPRPPREPLPSTTGLPRSLRPAAWYWVAASVCLLLFAAGYGLYRWSGAPLPGTPPPPASLFALKLERAHTGEMGYANREPAPDAVLVQLLPAAEARAAYRFGDTLQLFLPAPPPPADFSLRYDARQDRYVLGILNKKYPLEKGFGRQPLRELPR